MSLRKILTLLIFLSALISLSSSTAQAIDLSKNCNSVNSADCNIIKDDMLNRNQPSALKNGINSAIYVLGTISVMMIVIGGFKYTASNGDQSIVSSAKNTILYAVIGVVVALMAYAIVNTFITFL